MIAAAIQTRPVFGDKEGNISRAIQMMESVTADLYVLPELFSTGYLFSSREELKSMAEPLDGITVASLQDFSRHHQRIVFAGLPESAGDKLYNSSVLIINGALAAYYRKLHLWPYAEQGWMSKGDRGLAYADTPLGRIGLLVCYDVKYESVSSAVKEAGVDILLCPMAWVDNPQSGWFEQHLPAIARETGAAIVGANWSVPAKPRWYGYGHSRIIDSLLKRFDKGRHRDGCLRAEAAQLRGHFIGCEIDLLPHPFDKSSDD